MFCPNCGTQCADNISFCPACGTAVNQQPAAPAAPAAPVAPAAYETPVVPTAYDALNYNGGFQVQKSSKMKKILPFVICGAVLVVGIILALVFMGGSKSAEDVAEEFFVAYCTGDYETLQKYSVKDNFDADDARDIRLEIEEECGLDFSVSLEIDRKKEAGNEVDLDEVRDSYYPDSFNFDPDKLTDACILNGIGRVEGNRDDVSERFTFYMIEYDGEWLVYDFDD